MFNSGNLNISSYISSAECALLYLCVAKILITEVKILKL